MYASGKHCHPERSEGPAVSCTTTKQVLRFAQDDKLMDDEQGLPRRPMQRAPADQVHMQMKYRLPRARAHVHHCAVAIFNRPLPGNLRGGEVTAPQQLRV